MGQFLRFCSSEIVWFELAYREGFMWISGLAHMIFLALKQTFPEVLTGISHGMNPLVFKLENLKLQILFEPQRTRGAKWQCCPLPSILSLWRHADCQDQLPTSAWPLGTGWIQSGVWLHPQGPMRILAPFEPRWTWHWTSGRSASSFFSLVLVNFHCSWNTAIYLQKAKESWGKN